MGCNRAENQSAILPDVLQETNMLSDISDENLNRFKWINRPDTYSINNGVLTVQAEKGTDFFNNPEDSTSTATAPLLYQEIHGDFVATALVRPDFSSLWNAVALMVHIDDSAWIKFAFENSDATGKSIVSVVTKMYSDDANGAILKEADQIWLKLIRKNNVYAMHWSRDGKDYKMARLSVMPEAASVKIGIEAQCPVGMFATHKILFFGVVENTVGDLRKGN